MMSDDTTLGSATTRYSLSPAASLPPANYCKQLPHTVLFLTRITPPTLFQVLRAFRVLRLFGRLKNLRNIVTAISASIVPVLNAFLIIYLVASICSSPSSSCCRSESLIPLVRHLPRTPTYFFRYQNIFLGRPKNIFSLPKNNNFQTMLFESGWGGGLVSDSCNEIWGVVCTCVLQTPSWESTSSRMLPLTTLDPTTSPS